jgi:hypothetical protein
MKHIDISNKSWRHALFIGNECVRSRLMYDINTTNMGIQFNTLTHISNSMYTKHFDIHKVRNLK